jgi:hypothetical protein
VPPRLRRWALPALAALALLVAVIWWAASRPAADPVAEAVPETPSPAVEPPPPEPPPTGAVIVQALHWGRITEIADSDGFVQELPELYQTPVLLRLPPGSYRITLENPGSDEPSACEVEVTVDDTAACEVRFGDASALDYFKETGWWS